MLLPATPLPEELEDVTALDKSEADPLMPEADTVPVTESLAS